MELLESEYSWESCDLDGTLADHSPSGWDDLFNVDLSAANEAIKSSRAKVYPAPNQVFRAFYKTRLEDVRVVVLGQDPYHDGNATGLCFDVRAGGRINPSLRNMYAELEQEGYTIERDGSLVHWADNGVLLLNTALTVEAHDPGSHCAVWGPFTRRVVRYIARKRPGTIWMLMGAHAQSYIPDIAEQKDQNILKTSHPSPFSAHRSSKNARAFMGSGIFKDVEKHAGAPLWRTKAS